MSEMDEIMASISEIEREDAEIASEIEMQREIGGEALIVGFVGHPNVGKTSLLNALVGRKVASVSRTPGHTKHLQSWSLSPRLGILDSPGLVFPLAGAVVRVGGAQVDTAPRHVYEACGLFPLAQARYG